MDSEDFPRVLSLLSHELRGPLGVMRGYLRLLDQGAARLSEHQQLAISKALTASDRAAELLTQASTLAQMAREQTPLDLSTSRIGEILSAAIERVTLPPEPVLTLGIDGDTTTSVRADQTLLAAALASLITAVVRAQPVNGEIRLSVARAAGDGNGITLSMTALGPSAVTSTTALDLKRGGLGLDLPIAAMLVGAHGGTVEELREDANYAGVVVWLPSLP
ncbi:MAG TPA: histidine kinase dimerization/phospho-acceptor domain-containing protein [Vicinamibacterales bacterium]|nr:histidine kinase dimerization/phospho-acceptor domain-containing protein [Vicinamibacterales bacterium]